MKKVMLDRSIWDRMFKSLDLNQYVPEFSKKNFEILDLWLKDKKIKVVLYSIGEIESYVNRANLSVRERRWLETKEKDYNCETCKSLLHTNDLNSLTNLRTAVSNKGDIDISPSYRDGIVDKYHISSKKQRDLHTLIIMVKNKVDIFIHFDRDFYKDTQLKKFIADKGIQHKILILSDAICRIKSGSI